MTNQAILEKAIHKAIEGGWMAPLKDRFEVRTTHYNYPRNFVRFFYPEFAQPQYETFDAEAIIFNHDFAKALWGEELTAKFYVDMPDWEAHLMKMVIADDPVKYLGEHI